MPAQDVPVAQYWSNTERISWVAVHFSAHMFRLLRCFASMKAKDPIFNHGPNWKPLESLQ